MLDDNKQFDNTVSNTWMTFAGTLIRIVERSVVVFFDGMRNAVEHGTPSMLGFFSAILPLITPAPVAGMTAISLMRFFLWDSWQAWIMAIALEIAGFVLWVSLTETLIQDGWAGTMMQYFFAGAVIVYQGILIAVNAVLAAIDGADGTYVLVLLLLSLLPALGSISYGYRNAKIEAKFENRRKESKADKAKEREDKRAEKELKLRYAKDVKFTGFTEDRRPKVDRDCVNCGKSFKSSSVKAKYCSNACKQASYRKSH